MNSKRKVSTIWNFFFLNLRTIIAIVNGILIVPLYLHYININLYGAWLATGNIMMWLSIADPGVGDVLLQKVGNALGKNDRNEIGLAITSGLLISLLLFVTVLGIGLVCSYYVGTIIRYTGKDVGILITCFRLAIIGTCFSLLANTFNNILLGFQRTKEFGFYSTLISVFSIVFNIVLLISGAGIYSIAYTFLIRGLLTVLYSMVHSYIVLKRENISYKLDMSYTKSLINIFIYTFFGKTFNSLSGNIDLIIVSRYLGPEAVTLLELSRRPIRILTGFVNNITISALPAFSHLSGSYDKDKFKHLITTSITYIIWVTGFIVGGLLLFDSDIVAIWVGKIHYFGNTNNIISCFAYYLLSITYSISNILYSFGDIKKNNLVIIARNLIYLLVVAVFVSLWGITGELLAFLISIVLLNCTYFPIRILKLAELNKAEFWGLIKEILVGLLFFGLCAIITPPGVSGNKIVFLFSCGLAYTIIYLIYYYTISLQFRAIVNGKWNSFRSK
ncbi:Na+-driven multidrug efflux pump [Mucilaginibacter frigoritolerans]|jgi:O-antigen/teichoic acid export membrane protein|uniref:Na+-driven multidrug efflux pump n=1 Tax=Mucilaginibacter frigoritolerans TaxID=652788 RepID=A0A562UFN6_9SPHI|nr:oligosaccharide flippase family protein [Mucilaginibacter frigoritolerans]TWJ04614.1 Na+-driven multidrug efflux pump [Mucilaginibacter frigoritolerans]